jgi:hypothetical protein
MQTNISGPIAWLFLGLASVSVSACGGGGGGLASGPPIATVPPPPPPPPPPPTSLSTQPATTTGSYGAMAVLTADGFKTTTFSQPDEISLAIDQASNTYTLTVRQPAVATPITVFHPTSDTSLGILRGHFQTVLANGDRASSDMWLYLNSVSAGPHYASIGEWSYGLKKPAPDDTVKDDVVAYFVFGQRTAPGDIPASGTASYATTMLDAGCDCFGSANLTADFAARTMAANLKLSGYSPNLEYSASLDGSGSISTLGDFGFALTGTANTRNLTSGAVGAGPTTGTLAGALFGPQAVEAAGVFSVGLPDGSVAPGSFTATRK